MADERTKEEAKESREKILLDAQAKSWEVLTFGKQGEQGLIDPENLTVSGTKEVLLGLGALMWNPEIVATSVGMFITAMRKAGMDPKECYETADAAMKEALAGFIKEDKIEETHAVMRMFITEEVVKEMSPQQAISGLFDLLRKMGEKGGGHIPDGEPS